MHARLYTLLLSSGQRSEFFARQHAQPSPAALRFGFISHFLWLCAVAETLSSSFPLPSAHFPLIYSQQINILHGTSAPVSFPSIFNRASAAGAHRDEGIQFHKSAHRTDGQEGKGRQQPQGQQVAGLHLQCAHQQVIYTGQRRRESTDREGRGLPTF